MPLIVRILDQTLTVHADERLEAPARVMLADLVTSPDEERIGPEAITLDGDDVPATLLSLVGTVNLAAIRHGAGRLMPHAAAVARADGSVALLCGSSGSGKSTLTSALLAKGCSYLTDETTILEPDTLEVLPFRKPISLKPGSHGLYPHARPAWADPSTHTWCVPSTALGSGPVPHLPLAPDLMIFPQFDPGRDGIEVQPCEAGEAAYLVGSQSSRLEDVAGGPLSVLSRLVRRVRTFHLRYSDSDQAAERVLDLWSR